MGYGESLRDREEAARFARNVQRAELQQGVVQRGVNKRECGPSSRERRREGPPDPSGEKESSSVSQRSAPGFFPVSGCGARCLFSLCDASPQPAVEPVKKNQESDTLSKTSTNSTMKNRSNLITKKRINLRLSSRSATRGWLRSRLR